MKRQYILIGVLATTLLFISCSDDKAKADSHDDHDQHQTAETHTSGPDGLVLNNGQKWEMDEHTRNSFSNMANSFLEVDPAALEDQELKQSGAELQNELDVLIKGCTMTGEAHNQLHIYLTGYIPAVQELSEKGTVEAAEKVKHYLDIYDDYLE